MTVLKFASFLTVARRYSYNCVYIFHSIHAEKAVWKIIFSQTNIYKIFPATAPFSSVKKILEGACIKKTSKYIPQSALWISRLFIKLANRNKKVCLTLDCSNTNRDGPGRFRTETDTPDFQACYFNSANDEQVYNEFVSQRIKSLAHKNNFQFKTVELKSKTNSDLTFDASEELRDLQEMTQAQIEENKRYLKEVQKAEIRSSQISPLKKITDNLEKELNLGFFSNDNAVATQETLLVPKKKIRRNGKSNYSSTKVKARNFLTNVSYNRIKDGDFDNKSFVVDCYSFVLLFLNPFYLKRKFESQTDREYIGMFWCSLIPNEFYTFICKPDNYATLNKIKLRFQDTVEIIKSFTDDADTYQQIRDAIKRSATTFQYLYANLFPRYFSRIDDYGIRCKLTFENHYKFYQSQKNLLNWSGYSNPPNAKTETENGEVDFYTNPPTPTLDEPVAKTSTPTSTPDEPTAKKSDMVEKKEVNRKRKKTANLCEKKLGGVKKKRLSFWPI